MDIPKKIKVGGKIYTIDFPYKFKERGDLQGQCDSTLDIIRIGADDGCGNRRSFSSIVITLIHELLHAIDYDTGHKIFIENENALEGLSHGIYQVLVDNGFLKEKGNAISS